MNRTDRLVAMVLFLQGRRVVRAADLAAHFEVTERTVYRDISALSEAGVPIAGEAGVGYSLMKGYHLPPVMFTGEEAASLFVGGELVKQFTDPSLQAPMASALDKLRAVLPRDNQDQVDRLVRSTLVVGKGPSPGLEPSQPMLMPVQQGVVQGRVLRMVYRGRERDADTAREVEPLGVVYYGGAWYLVAWCRLRKDYRHFRVDRIKRLELQPEKFAVRPDFSLVRHMREQAEREREGMMPATVWFHQRVQEKARRESYATLIPGQARDGGAEFTLYTWSFDWLAQWLMSFGPAAEAVDPPELREAIRRQAKQVIEKHSS
jgi:predicted DNA-binding transcriptional regulator YafY